MLTVETHSPLGYLFKVSNIMKCRENLEKSFSNPEMEWVSVGPICCCNIGEDLSNINHNRYPRSSRLCLGKWIILTAIAALCDRCLYETLTERFPWYWTSAVCAMQLTNSVVLKWHNILNIHYNPSGRIAIYIQNIFREWTNI